MTQSPHNEWKLNTLSFAGRAAQMKGAFRRAALVVSSSVKSSSPITMPTASKLKTSPKTILSFDKESIFVKSYAQVAPSVLPHMVIPKACELKLKDAEAETGKRPSPLTLRASEGHKEILRRKAKAVGVPVGRYILAAALGVDYKPPSNPELVKALLALNRELTAQGNNINQIAKHLNNGTASPAEADGMLGIVARSHIQTHKAIRAALSEGKESQP